jgi:hypothetical protein
MGDWPTLILFAVGDGSPSDLAIVRIRRGSFNPRTRGRQFGFMAAKLPRYVGLSFERANSERANSSVKERLIRLSFDRYFRFAF